MGPDTGQAAAVRPFAEVLSEVNRGIVADEAATKLAELVSAVQETGKKGTLKVVIEVAPVKGNDTIVQVSGAVDARPPRPASPTSFLTETTEQAAKPWNAGKLAGVLTGAVYEHFTDRPGPFTLSAHGRDEQYELLDGEPDDDVLTFERKADGSRFHVEFWVNVSAAASGQPS